MLIVTTYSNSTELINRLKLLGFILNKHYRIVLD